jgi:hypothetical protein
MTPYLEPIAAYLQQNQEPVNSEHTSDESFTPFTGTAEPSEPILIPDVTPNDVNGEQDSPNAFTVHNPDDEQDDQPPL